MSPPRPARPVNSVRSWITGWLNTNPQNVQRFCLPSLVLGLHKRDEGKESVRRRRIQKRIFCPCYITVQKMHSPFQSVVSKQTFEMSWKILSCKSVCASTNFFYNIFQNYEASNIVGTCTNTKRHYNTKSRFCGIDTISQLIIIIESWKGEYEHYHCTTQSTDWKNSLMDSPSYRLPRWRKG